MGENSSALKKSRKASKQARRPSTLGEPTNKLLSREDSYAVSSSDGVESTQLSPIDTSSEALPPVPELEAETGPITLAKLSTELILDIAEYLSPSGYMSLSYSCRTIRNQMGVSFAEVLGDRNPKGGLSGSTLSIELRNVRYLERLELWSMLVRDGKISHRKASHSGYQLHTIDGHSLVKSRLYAPLGTAHRHLGTAGLLWVCPHRVFRYNDIIDAKKKKETDDNHMCGSCFVSSSRGFGNIWSIMLIPANSVPTSKEVVEALRPLEAPVCPHLRLNDASVARIYDPRCQNLHDDKNWADPGSVCRCSVCVSGKRLTVVCGYCDTSILFDIQPHRGQARFSLLIHRTHLLGRSRINREWIAQIVRPADLEE